MGWTWDGNVAGRLAGQIVWVTGSARRIGREIALGCAREGADVVVHCHRSRDEGEATARDIEALGRRALLVQGDHGDSGGVRAMVEEIRRGMGSLSALVNSAAAFPSARFEDISEADFFAVVRTNTWGPFLCAQAALPLLRQASPGRIVNLTDWAVGRPYKHYAHYMASKGGLSTLTRALARELAPGVLVNAIAPGPVLEPPDLDPATRQRIVDKIPVGHWGDPGAIVKAVVFLLESDNLCGEEIVVDGGRTIG